jgi:leader peptidase (prepilin peptidase)/N-methyltransferase
LSLLILVFVVLGLLVGSFLNVCIDRLPRGQSIVRPPSHCSSCNQKLAIKDLIPLFSYLWLRGRCRYCQARIPLRLPIVEGVIALLFALIYWRYGLEPHLAIALFYACILTVIFFIDLEHQLVLNKITYPGMIVALMLSMAWPEIGNIGSIGGIPGKLLNSLTGGTIGLAFMALPLLIYRRGMGLGDVKLGALIGLMTGYPIVFVALLMSVISGGLVSISLLVTKIKSRKDPIPFAPFMAASAMVAVLWGQAIWDWYLY